MEAKKTILCVSLILFIAGICGTTMAATQAQIEAADANGVAWLAAQQNSSTGYWQDGSQLAGPTGLALIKLQERAFELRYTPFDPCYPYEQNVEKGLTYLFSQMSVIHITTQPHGNPDSDGDGNGVSVHSSTYETGIALMAIAASMAPDRVVNSPDSPVNGWTYKRVLQNMVDYMAFGQIDSGNGRGGWAYSYNSGNADNSNSGYAVSGLGYAESPRYGFNCVIPQFVKDELKIWINYIQHNGGSNDGGSGYTGPDSMVNLLKTGSLIFQMTFAEIPLEDPNMQRALAYIGRNWSSGWSGDCQAMYCAANGLWYSNINDVNQRDWYADLADALVNTQQTNGSWSASSYGGNVLGTEWALLTLEMPTSGPLPSHLNLTKTDDVNEGDCVGPGREITYTINYSYSNVSFEDLARFVQWWLVNDCGSKNNCNGMDMNADGVVDFVDFAIFANSWQPIGPFINDVNIIDHLPAGVEFISASDDGVYNSDACTVTWNIGTLRPGDFGSVTLKVVVKPCIEPGSTITNECEIRSGNMPYFRDYDTAYEYTPVGNPTLTKVADVNDYIEPGNTINYSICYAANGYGDTDVVIIDELPDEVDFNSASDGGVYNSNDRTVTWTIGTLEPNESGCFALTVEVNENAEPGSTITNCSRMTGSCIDIRVCDGTAVPAVEVINVDFNVDKDANDYTGKGAFDTGKAVYDDGASRWLVFEPNMTIRRTSLPGWGIPIGSPRSSHLGDSNDPNNPAIYARQVWIGDRGVGRVAYRDANYPSPGLMNDGFQRTSGEPNIFLWGKDAYTGTYDIYVYGNGAGDINVVKYNAEKAVWEYNTVTLTGSVPYGQFVQGGNYAKFTEVNILDSNCVLKTLYVDGVKIGAGGNADVLRFYRQFSNDGHQLAIAADGNLPIPKNSGFNGMIDEFAIYKGVLSDARILAHKNATAANYYNTVNADTPLVWYRFDDAHTGDGYSVADSGSAGLTGTYYSNASRGGSITQAAGHATGNAAVFTQGTDSNNAWIWVDDVARKLSLENITVECWIKTTQADGNSPSIFNHNPSREQQNAYGATLRTDTNGIGMIGAGNTNNVDVNGLNDGNWHHIVITYRDVAGGAFIHYTNKINGLQLVSTKRPVVIKKTGTAIVSGRYDVAGEWSSRTGGQPVELFGPSLVDEANWSLHPNVSRIERREYMEYDIAVDEKNKGRYQIKVDCDPCSGAVIIGLFLDDANLGTVMRAAGASVGPTTAVEANLFPGSHVIKWMHVGDNSPSPDYGINVLDINLIRLDWCVPPRDANIGELNFNAEDWLDPNGRYPRAVMADNPIVYLRFEGDTPMEEIENSWRYLLTRTFPDTSYDYNLATLVGYGNSGNYGEGEVTRTMAKKAGGIGKSIFLNSRQLQHTSSPSNGWGFDGHACVANAWGSGGTLKPGYDVMSNDSNYSFVKGDVTYEFWIKRAKADEPQRLWPNRRLMAAVSGAEPEPNIYDTNLYPYYSTIFTQADISSPAAAPQMDFAEGNGGEPCDAVGNIRVRCGVPIAGQNDWYTGVSIPGTDTQWHQLVLVYDVNGIGDPCRYGPGKGDDTNVMDVYLYKDGVLAASKHVVDPNRDQNPNPGNPQDPNNHGAGRAKTGPWSCTLLIGASGSWSYGLNGFSGYIDEVAIYPGKLDPNRIAAHYEVWVDRK